MKKKILLLNISKSVAEIDWILPVLYKLKDVYQIFTLFQNKNAFQTLKKDKILFKLWKEVSPNYAIDNIFEKLWKYICSKFFKKYNIKNYFLRKKVTFSEISIFLSEFSTYSAIIDEIKERENRPVIIHFPNSAYIFPKSQDNTNIRYSLKGDYLFLNNELDKDYWKSRIDENKIIIVGIPKHDNDWIQKLLIKKNSDEKKKPIIVVTYSSKFDIEKKNKIELELQLNQLMGVLSKFKNHKIIFKIHPRKNDPYYLKILKKYNDIEWEVSSKNLLQLANDCSIYVHDRQSSSFFDGLVLKKPCIEYWDLSYNSNYQSANDSLSLNIRANNPIELENFIKLAIEDPQNKIWISQQQSYISNCKKFNDKATNAAADYIITLDRKNDKRIAN